MPKCLECDATIASVGGWLHLSVEQSAPVSFCCADHLMDWLMAKQVNVSVRQIQAETARHEQKRCGL
jgi:hypothetical protein